MHAEITPVVVLAYPIGTDLESLCSHFVQGLAAAWHAHPGKGTAYNQRQVGLIAAQVAQQHAKDCYGRRNYTFTVHVRVDPSLSFSVPVHVRG